MPDHADAIIGRPLSMGLAVGTLGPKRPDYSLAVIIVMAVLTLAGVLALLPSTEEKAAALIARERYVEAIALLEKQDGANLLNTYEAFSLIRLYRMTGSDSKAATLLERTLERDPSAHWARDELVEIYRAEGRRNDEARLLQQAFSEQPDKTSFKRLLGLYRLDGDREAESKLLVQADAAGLIGPSERLRLNWLQTHGSVASAATLWKATEGSVASLGGGLPEGLGWARQSVKAKTDLFPEQEIVQ